MARSALGLGARICPPPRPPPTNREPGGVKGWDEVGYVAVSEIYYPDLSGDNSFPTTKAKDYP